MSCWTTTWETPSRDFTAAIRSSRERVIGSEKVKVKGEKVRNLSFFSSLLRQDLFAAFVDQVLVEIHDADRELLGALVEGSHGK